MAMIHAIDNDEPDIEFENELLDEISADENTTDAPKMRMQRAEGSGD